MKKLLNHVTWVANLGMLGEDAELLVEVLNFRPAIPAKLYGPPELCYPAEPAEFDLGSIFLMLDYATAIDITKAMAEPLALDEAFAEFVIEQLSEVEPAESSYNDE